jgi:hypothetical protein
VFDTGEKAGMQGQESWVSWGQCCLLNAGVSLRLTGDHEEVLALGPRRVGRTGGLQTDASVRFCRLGLCKLGWPNLELSPGSL